MVAYCCVKGCNNNSSNKKKDPNDMTSFHAFPSNVEMKQKWLRAIGRPDWTPPGYSRVCSGHFSYEQINHDGRRIRIKDDAVPVKDLPANSNFEASEVEVCRFCLAAEVRLHSLQDGVHRVYLESLVGYNENYSMEGLPQFICYECAAHLKKCYHLLEKSLTVQATLLDIFSQYGKITTNLINSKNRKELNLSSPLTIHEIKTNYEFEHSYELEDYEMNVNEIEDKVITVNYITVPKLEIEDIETHPEGSIVTENCDAIYLNVGKDMDFKIDDRSDVFDDGINIPAELSSDEEVIPETDRIVLDELKVKDTKPKRQKKSVKASGSEGLTPDEVNMQKYFNIVKLTLDQQIEEWRENNESKQYSGESYTCEICSKVFAHHNTRKMHIQSHDPTRGSAECPVCKLRFKNQVLARSHANRAHAKKFYCKSCPKIFNNVGVAKKHHLWHAGHVYACPACPFVSAHASALGAHSRSQHGAAACARCGRACRSARGLLLHARAAHRRAPESEDSPKYRCEQCGLNFKSEGARRVHLLTSIQHKKKPSLCDTTPRDASLHNACSACGEQFASRRALAAHARAQHARRAPPRRAAPGDSYPAQCEHCGEEVGSRAEHWRHWRRAHPRLRYRPVVAAVCHVCGKGFQNSTKLRLHLLRHGAPREACGRCARAFFDAAALARHAATHRRARPHRCASCPRAFKQRGNLLRHKRVHTGVTPYECSICGKKFKYSTSMNLHVRTVHYKLPPPPRKRKNKKLDESDSNHGK